MNDHALISLIRVARGPWSPNVQVLISAVQGKSLAVAAPISFQAIEPGQIVEAQLELNPSDAQSLMDQLWACGLRPTEGSGSAGALSAVQAHLADFRKLVFDDPRLRP